MGSRFRGQELKDDNLFGFVLPTYIPRFKFLHVCSKSLFPISSIGLFSISLTSFQALFVKCLFMKATY